MRGKVDNLAKNREFVRLGVQVVLPERFLPFNYNYFFTSEIFSRLRSKGLDIHGGKAFFTFSRIILRSRKRVKGGFSAWEGWFVFSSPVFEEVKAFLETAIDTPLLRLGRVKIEMVQFYVDTARKGLVKTLSPITVYRSSGEKKVFLSPDNPEFVETIKEELERKFLALYNRKPDGDFHFMTLKFRKTVVVLKSTPYVAYDVVAELEGGELADFALETGLGKKTKFGFGTLGVFTGRKL